MPPRRLDPQAPYKPLDVGNGVVSGYLTPSGQWLEIGIAHRHQGRVVVSDTSTFSGDARDQGAVRAYRRWLASGARAGFGLDALATGGRAALLEDSLPTVVHARAALRLEATAFAPAGRRGVVQVV